MKKAKARISTRPNILVWKASREDAEANGKSVIMVRTRSEAPRRAKQPPSAISELEAKKAVPCCSPDMMAVSTMRTSRSAMLRIQASR
ncbi:MAG: hypothetical protein E5W99_16245 [Mesorhizobium sp.]|nr:MAG: hypothetical protein E5W99_16245 [Mesorhizobium sp.]